MNTMEYKGYNATIEYDSDEDSFFGIVDNVTDVIHFEGKSVKELREQFKKSLEAYIEACKKINRDPQRPFSGKFQVRISPDLHRRITLAARRSGKSLNAFVTEAIEQADKMEGI